MKRSESEEYARKRILIVSANRFPNGDAGAVREYAIAKLFQLIGWEPLVIGMGKSTSYEQQEFLSVKYVSFRNKKHNLLSRFAGRLNYVSKLRTFLRRNGNAYKAILVVSVPLPALFLLKQFSKRNEVFLCHESVEWYSPEEFRCGKLSISYIINNLYNTRWIDSSFRVIAISRYLENQFRHRGCTTVRIPAILDVRNTTWTKRTSANKLTIVYAGSPGRKDFLKEMLQGISQLDDALRKQVEFRIIGPTREEVKRTCGVTEETLEKLQGTVVFSGHLARDEVLKHLEEADFTALLRSPVQRYARAGFPTKVAESLASGTPVMCNLTSDLELYIHDGDNGIVVDGYNADAFSAAVKRALGLTDSALRKMYTNARRTAEESFDYRDYVDTVTGFLPENKENGGSQYGAI